ncbi:MAG: Uma2 family endonuclease [Acidobacteria bacterium]|nr:Uma2 family endonuclease [Acidobacteriota bacterium]
MAERLGPNGLTYGTVRKPAAPLSITHDKLVGRLHAALGQHVTSRNLGRLWVGVEIVLDRREGLVLQPDITFIVDGRESIVSDRVWGPPDMVLEVTSPHTHPGQLEERVAWFSLYGVREYWLVQPQHKDIAILKLAHGGVRRRTLLDDITPIASPLLPEFNCCLGELLI